MKVQSPTLCDPVDCSMSGLPHYLLEVAQVHVHWIIDAIQPSHPLSPSSPSAFNLSQHQRLLQWVGSSHQVVKVLELQLQHQSFSKYSGLISFQIDWFDLLVVQGTLKSLFRHHNLKESIFRCSAFYFPNYSPILSQCWGSFFLFFDLSFKTTFTLLRYCCCCCC